MKVKEESEKVGLKLNIQKMKTMASGPITSWQIDGETVETAADFILGGSKITAGGDGCNEIKRGFKTIPMEKKCKKALSTQSYGFSSSHVWMWVLDYKESWAPKNWCFWTVVLKKTWEPLGLQGDPTSPS